MSDGKQFSLLEALLDRLYAAVRSGDLGALPLLAPDLATTLADLPAAPDAACAARLRQKARRNAACLDAAARGLRSAQRRLREIAAVAAGGTVYDGRGKARRMTAGPDRLAGRF